MFWWFAYAVSDDSAPQAVVQHAPDDPLVGLIGFLVIMFGFGGLAFYCWWTR